MRQARAGGDPIGPHARRPLAMTRPRRPTSTRMALPLLGTALATAILAAGSAGAATSRTVSLKDIAFSPTSLKLSKGTKVVFAFRDGTTVHNVRSTGRTRFKSISNRSSGSVTRTLTRAGTYRYECTLHPGMTGRIVVR
jgi:plastocyanin